MPYIGNQHNVGDHVNNFKVLDDISSHTATFDGSATSVISAADDTIRIPEHRFIQGQRVTYTNGGGGNIGGLTSGTAYFVSFDSANTIKLATTLANANSNTVINLSGVGSGTSHTLNAAFDGVNTKFKMTHGSGVAARLNNATQINVAINNVIQRPNLDPNNFTDGFALEDNHKIVFKTAPTVDDIFWGSIIANTIENFDLRDNEVDNFTGNGSATEFTLSTIPANNESVIVTIDGVLQHPSDSTTTRAYTLIDSIIQFTAAPALNAEIQVRHIGFAGASTNDVSGFYGRTGNVTLTANDHITTGDITARNFKASGITTFSGSVSTGAITATSGTFSGSVSIGGTLTYEDVTNVDSVGIVTALGFKTRGTSSDAGATNGFTAGRINIYDNGSHNIFRIGNHPGYAPSVFSTSAITFQTNSFSITNTASTRNYILTNNTTGILQLGYGGASNYGYKLATSAKGINVGTGVTIETNGQATYTGIVTATSFSGSGANLTGVLKNIVEDSSPQLGGDLDTNGYDINFADTKVAYFGTNNDLRIYHSGTHGYIKNTTNNLYFMTTNSKYGALMYANAGVELRYDNVKKFETTNTGATLTGTLISDGLTLYDNEKLLIGNNTDIEVFHDGTNSIFQSDTGDLQINSGNSAGNVEINVNNNVAGNTRETSAKFIKNGAVELYYDNLKKFETISSGISVTGQVQINTDGGSGALTLGASQDFRLYHDANGPTIFSDTGNQGFKLQIKELNLTEYTGSTTRLKITSTGNVGINETTPEAKLEVDGRIRVLDNNDATPSTGKGLEISYFNTADYADILSYDRGGSAYKDLHLRGNNLVIKTGTTERLRITSSGEVRIPSGSNTTNRLTLGGAIDIYHDGNTKFENVTGYLKFYSANNLYIDGAQLYFRNSAGTNRWIVSTNGHLVPGAAGTYNIGSTSEEIGNVYIADNKKVQLGNSQDFQIYHQSSDNNSYIVEGGSGSLMIQGDIINIGNVGSSKYYIRCFEDGAVQLRYGNNLTKLATTATGIDVTGEVAASQDYPDIRPALDLNFAATKKLDSRFKYARSGRASFINEHGLLEIVNANEPRFDHDPVTRECKGLLFEEARTNLLTYSNINNMSSPNLGGNPQINDTVNNITLPTGEKGDVRRYLAASGGGGGRWGDYSGTNNTSYTGSVWIRTVSGTGTAIIDINDGGGKTINLTTEWQRVTTTHSSNNTYRFFDIYFASPVTIYYWGVQIEESYYMTSYIPTNSSTATRGGDSLILDDMENEIGYNQNEGSVIMDFSYTQDTDGAHTLFTFSGTSSNPTDSGVRQWLRINQSAGTPNTIRYVQNSNNSDSSATLTPGVFQRIAFAYEDGDQDVSLGGTSILDTSRTPNTNIFRLSIGNVGWNLGYQTTSLEGHVKRFTYYPKKLPNSQLNNLTS